MATVRGSCSLRHMDEIGFFVSHIDDNGFLRLQPVGGFDARILVAQRVLVHGFAGSVLRGALQPGTKPIHILDRDEIKPAKMEELFVDLGLPVERVRAEVELGDIVTLDRELEEVGDCVMSKALDDRVGIFVMLEALRAMKQSTAEIVAVATTQEEVGLRGAQTTAFEVQPDIAVALDTPSPSTSRGCRRSSRSRISDVVWPSRSWTPPTSPTQRCCGTCVTWPRPMGSTTSSRSCRAGGPTRARCNVREAARQRSRCRSHRAMSTPSTRWPTAQDIAGAISLLARFLEDAGSRSYGYEP